ncbi:alanine dehydrogenase [Egibacter rhizosphaerae]|uniref:alanine dehydrogenase n=1 Tax=Egibacter rhizosphaerae TaxID=1670831 RepID=UPI00197ACA00|nr:alanine dehydrogenase [Egibacter rhizosphaerae]
MAVIGIVAEIKDGERRVALDPPGAGLLVDAGHEVVMERGAGEGSGFPDPAYERLGVKAVAREDAWGADLVVKVKEPEPSEWAHLRSGLRLFCFLHLAAVPELAAALAERGVEAHAFETVEDQQGRLPLLAPMSEIAGRAAAVVAAGELAAGSGTLLGGAAGVPSGRAVVVGLGTAGRLAARGLRGLDATVTGMDIDLDRMREDSLMGLVESTRTPTPDSVGEAVADADVVVGAALVPGARAPTVVRREHVAAMHPGSVIVDLAIDQGGCIETARPTVLSDPVYVEEGVHHYCVTNVPGQFPRTASRALAAAVAPAVEELASAGPGGRLPGSCNVRDGEVVHGAVAEAVEAARGRE